MPAQKDKEKTSTFRSFRTFEQVNVQMYIRKMQSEYLGVHMARSQDGIQMRNTCSFRHLEPVGTRLCGDRTEMHHVLRCNGSLRQCRLPKSSCVCARVRVIVCARAIFSLMFRLFGTRNQ